MQNLNFVSLTDSYIGNWADLENLTHQRSHMNESQAWKMARVLGTFIAIVTCY